MSRALRRTADIAHARTHPQNLHKGYHGRNNLAHGPHNPGDFLAAIVYTRLRFVTALICKTEFSIGPARADNSLI